MFFSNSSGKEVIVIMPQHFAYLLNTILLVVYKKHFIILFVFLFPHYFWFIYFWCGQEKKRWKEKLWLIVPESIIEEKYCIQLRLWAIKDFNYCITMAIYCLSFKTSLPFPWLRMQQQVICWRCWHGVHKNT